MRRRLSPIQCSLLAVLAGHIAFPRASGQDSASALDRRFRFAELFLGADAIGLGGADGVLAVPGRTLPRVAVGGLHFWGRADFAVLFPITPGERSGDGRRTRLTPGIETRGRFLLRSLDCPNWSPYVGAALGAVDVELGDGPRLFQFRPVLQAGLALRTKRTKLEAGWAYGPGGTLQYPAARDRLVGLTPRPHAWTLGVHRLFETTTPIGAAVSSGEVAAREERWRAAGRLSGPTIAAGPTAMILTGASSWNAEQRPWLAERPRGRPALDIGVGWYNEPRDVQVNVAWRRGRFTTSAYGFTQHNQRESFALEAFAFLADYHGFVPFVGPVVSREHLQLRERDGGTLVTDVARKTLAPGVTFGWDIRPTRSQPWLLRTNLRWFPRLRLPLPGGAQAFDQVEFNFIQLVWYPRRRG